MLYDKYGKLAYSLACRIVGDSVEAEDVVQEAFVSVWRMSASFNQGRGSVKTWLLSVVHHRSIDLVRRRRGQTSLDTEIELSDNKLGVWDEVSLVLDRQIIVVALRQIPEEQKKVIELAYFGGFTHREIAEMTKQPLGTVKGRIRMGMEKLRDLMKDAQVGA